MDIIARVGALPSTTFSGRRFSRKQIVDIIETICLFKNLSRTELARTICEHFDWRTPGHQLKVNSALELIDKFEELNLCQLPPRKLGQRPGIDNVVDLQSWRQPLPVKASLAEIEPVTIKVVDIKEDRQKFNLLMAEHHYLGYKRPFGAHLRYFILDKDGSELGLFLFAASAWSLKDRDEWIGWGRKHRLKRLHLVVSNSRFLILPHIRVPNLASRVLRLVSERLSDDWQKRYGYRPVLVETFVDRQYFGTCYQAANWLKIGETAGRGRFDEHGGMEEAIKDLYVYPLTPNFRAVLLQGETSSQIRSNSTCIEDKLCRVHDKVLSFWSSVAPLIRKIAAEFDASWRLKRRVINSMLLVMLIFRLVATRAKHGYGTVIDELWENCRKQRLPLPQKKPIAASAFTVARRKLDEEIFKIINNRVLSEYEATFDKDEFRLFGHRLYAIDGTKINLPRPLIANDFMLPDKNAHYPLGLFSCLYRLKAQIPVDFMLTNEMNERAAALIHLASLAAGDIVVYDRGYFGYAFLQKHKQQGIHAVFRLITSSTYGEIESFVNSRELDRIATIEVSTPQRRKKIRRIYPDIVFEPLSLRLVKYFINGQVYCLGTTLHDPQYSIESLKGLYHGRWGIEELYKISKHLIGIEEFHAQCLRGVKQELYANMAMITLNRIFTNYTDDLHNKRHQSQNIEGKSISNFKNSIAVTARNIESLLVACARPLRVTILSILDSLQRRFQAVRPDRSYPRISKKPKPSRQRGIRRKKSRKEAA